MPKEQQSKPTKQRFRDIKQGRVSPMQTKNKQNSSKTTLPYASASDKLKAFLTDSFMLLMPIMYAVFYLVMGGREGFAAHKALGWLYILLPLVLIQTVFMFKTGQTPGYRAYDLEVVDEHTQKRPSPWLLLFRNLAAILSAATLFGWMLMFFRKDRKNLHDLLSGTVIIKKS
ncbi:FIG00732228: membrane protein [hydrothermal vent metagenome]|uniref:FIG00732228: membrane protein n=1 Tax=hydrothermal vent metagenome TaxID=652676 RepID=A0A1W1E9S4_9ZZZZ